ncbi:peptide transporter family 1 isoform X2 [Anoplophora glabripennis]|nr:peptide transporter family 1 isoform X2 [Anoplophora glabripennis]
MGAEPNDTKENPQDNPTNRQTDEENNEEKLPYPKSVFFIVSNEFCERFSYYGMRTILVLYLTNILLYSEADAKIVYHAFTVLVYFFPILGAILSDSFLGKFNTIFYVSMVYATGSILLALASAEPIGLPQAGFSIFGLVLIAFGTGGIKPCVSAFGGDQFVLPQQELQLSRFFSLFYFAINAGSLISTFLTPILRNNVHCFDQESCFPLAFAVPGALMIISIVIFGLGKPLYKIKKPEGNLIVQVTKCISHAISQKCKSSEKKEHWLDHAEPRFGAKMVNDIKATLKVLIIYIPLPIFWALYDQQGSGWTFQAVRMDGNIGFYTILPDQMQVINPLLILAFIPLFSYVVYPVFAKCNFLKTPLQRMACGGFLAAVAFCVSALISIALEATYPVVPSSGNIQVRVYNPSSGNLTFESSELGISGSLPQYGYYVNRDISFSGNNSVQFTFNEEETSFLLEDGKAFGFYLSDTGVSYYADDVEKSEDGYPKIRTLSYSSTANITYSSGDESLSVENGDDSLKSLSSPGSYSIEGFEGTTTFKLGGTYTVMINHATANFETVTVTEPNSVHMLWLLPQYIIITAAEIMFSITGLEFSYSQAPVSMKSLMTACFLLTTAFGNLIIVIIESAKIFDKQSNDFFLYTGLMVVDILLFTFLAMRYTYVIPEDTETEELNREDAETKKLSNGIENPSFTSVDNSTAKE